MSPAQATPRREVVLVTGLSGAGKASILRVLEDLGFETVDNPPLSVLESLVSGNDRPIAACVDSRTRDFDPDAVLKLMDRLRLGADVTVSLIFATAEEEVLLRRYTESRRRHPLAPTGRVADGIAREEKLLAPLLEAADMLVDTSDLPLPELRRRIDQRYRSDESGVSLTVLSFSFAKGVPREADLVFDLRFLRNPHYDPALRPMTGRDAPVAAFIEADPDFPAFWDRLTGFVEPLLPRFVAEGKKYLTIAMGCTGGRHRSVLAAEKLAAHLASRGWRVALGHRELGIEARSLQDVQASNQPSRLAPKPEMMHAAGDHHASEASPTPRQTGLEALTNPP